MKKLNKKIKIGSWITTFNPSATDLMSSLGFEWLCIDLEHSSISLSQMEHLISIIEKNGCHPFVRVGKNDDLIIKRSLDCGARGIIVPMIKNKNDAKKAVASCKYPPLGIRGVGFGRAQLYGFNFKNYIKYSKKIPIILQIEHKDAIKNLTEILSVSGISGTLIGPSDLSASLGSIGKLNSSSVKKALAYYEKMSKKYKIKMGIHLIYPNLNKYKQYLKKGYQFVAVGTDMIFLGDACQNFIKKI